MLIQLFVFSVQSDSKTKLVLKIHKISKYSGIKKLVASTYILFVLLRAVSKPGCMKLCPGRKAYLHWPCSEGGQLQLLSHVERGQALIIRKYYIFLMTNLLCFQWPPSHDLLSKSKCLFHCWSIKDHFCTAGSFQVFNKTLSKLSWTTSYVSIKALLYFLKYYVKQYRPNEISVEDG